MSKDQLVRPQVTIDELMSRRIIDFCCEWLAYSGNANAERSRFESGMRDGYGRYSV